MTKTLAQLGLVVYLLAGRWNGNHLPAMVRMNEVVFGLNMTSSLRRCVYIRVLLFRCKTSEVSVAYSLLNKHVKARASAYQLQKSDVNYTPYLCDIKYCGIVVSLTHIRGGCILMLRSDIMWLYWDSTRRTNDYTG